MSNIAVTTSDKHRFTITPYLAIWGMLALGATAYIGWVATHPEMLARSESTSPATPGESNEGQRAMSDTLAEVRALKDTVGEVQRDVIQLKTDLSSTSERNQQLLNRVAALEEKPGKTTTTAAAPTTPAVAPTTPAAAPAAAKSADAKPAPAPPKVLNAPRIPAKKPLETGSVAAALADASIDAAPVVFGPAVVKPTAKPVGIQIATGPSVDAVRLSWSILSDRHSDTLKNLEARVLASQDAEGLTYDLIAGPIKSSAEAKKVCAALEAQAVACKVSDFKGEAL